MYLLFFFLVPAAYIYYLAGCRDIEITDNLLAYISGIIAGLCTLLVCKLVLLLIPQDTSSFFVKFLSIFLLESGIPYICGIAALVFILNSPVKQRILNIRPQLFGISTIYLPYTILTSYNFPDTWSTIMIPIMLLSILFLADFFICRLAANISITNDIPDLILAFFPLGLALILADFCKTLWFFCFPAWIYFVLSFLLICASIAPRLFKYHK